VTEAQQSAGIIIGFEDLFVSVQRQMAVVQEVEQLARIRHGWPKD
jgi:hypothetical protein